MNKQQILNLISKHTKEHSHSFHSRGGGYTFTHFYKEEFAEELASRFSKLEHQLDLLGGDK
jgi:hypothetical protein